MQFSNTVFFAFSMLLITSCAENKPYTTNSQQEMVFEGEKSPSEQYREEKEFEDRQRDIYRTIR